MKRSILSLFVFVLICTLLGHPTQPVQAAATLFAAADGAGTSCLESAPCTLQTAAANAAAGDFIYVEEGTYTRSAAYDEVVKFDRFVIVIASCIFDGVDGTPPVCGQAEPHRSIIDGQLYQRGILIENPGVPTPPNVYLHHLTIQNGEAEEVDNSTCTADLGFTVGGCGGGIFINGAGIIYLNDIVFDQNYAGNYLTNTEAGFGGGVYIQDTWDVTITDSIFVNNNATYSGQGFGGGVFATNVGNEMTIENSTFTSNDCTTTDSTQSKGCGAMFFESEDVFVQDNTFHLQNSSFASAINGSALYFLRNHSFELSNNDFTYNKGNSVIGADKSSNASLDIIAGNTFYDNDQALNLIQYVGKYWVNIYNNFFNHITSDPTRGGPVFTAINLSSNYIAPLKSIANIYHNSISFADYGMKISDNFILIIKNNIITYTYLMGIDLPASPANMSTSFKTNLFYNNSGGDGIYDPSSVNHSPGFINIHSDLHLQATSWAIDRGTSDTGITTDIDGDTRPNSGYDIGADEAYGKFYFPMITR